MTIIVPTTLQQVLDARFSKKSAERKLYADFVSFMTNEVIIKEHLFLQDVQDYRALFPEGSQTERDNAGIPYQKKFACLSYMFFRKQDCKRLYYSA